jgi:hypothetical protein
MANTFKSTPVKLTATTATTLYTVPSLTTSIVKSLYVSNIDATSPATIDVYFTRSATDYYIIKGASVAVTTTLQVVTESLVLQASDVLKVKASVANRLDCTVSYLEIT